MPPPASSRRSDVPAAMIERFCCQEGGAPPDAETSMTLNSRPNTSELDIVLATSVHASRSLASPWQARECTGFLALSNSIRNSHWVVRRAKRRLPRLLERKSLNGVDVLHGNFMRPSRSTPLVGLFGPTKWRRFPTPENLRQVRSGFRVPEAVHSLAGGDSWWR